MACTVTPIESLPCTGFTHVVRAFSNDVEVYKDHNQAFYFDADTDRNYWHTDMDMDMVEKVLKHTSEAEWVATWRLQFDNARANDNWNFNNRHLIYRGYEEAKPTFVMGNGINDAFETLVSKFLETLNKDNIHFVVERLAYVFKPISGHLYVGGDCVPMMDICCEVQLPSPK